MSGNNEGREKNVNIILMKSVSYQQQLLHDDEMIFNQEQELLKILDNAENWVKAESKLLYEN